MEIVAAYGSPPMTDLSFRKIIKSIPHCCQKHGGDTNSERHPITLVLFHIVLSSIHFRSILKRHSPKLINVLYIFDLSQSSCLISIQVRYASILGPPSINTFHQYTPIKTSVTIENFFD